MKKKCACFLRMSIRASVPLLAAACFSAAGLAAAPENTPAGAKPSAPPAAKQPAVTPLEKQAAGLRDQKNLLILQKLTEAENLASSKQYLKAIQVLAGANDLLKAEMPTGKDGKKYLPQGQFYLKTAQERYKADLAAFRVIAGEQKFQEAKKLYGKALRMGLSAESSRLFTQVKTLAAEANVLYYTGTLPGKTAQTKELDECIRQNPDFSVRVARLSESCDRMIRAYDFRSKTDLEAIDPDYENRQQKIETFYAQGEKLYREQRYTQARDQLEKILILDPNHQNAIHLLDKIYKKLYFYAELRQYNEILRNDAETVWNWSQGFPADRTNAEFVSISRPSSSSLPLLNKISSWRKISIKLINCDVHSALDQLGRTSKEADPEGRGFSIIRKNLDNTGVESQTISLELNNVPIEEVLRYLCQKAGIRYKFQNNMIVVGKDIDEYETRFIPIKYSIIQQIVEGNAAGGEEASSSSGGDEKGGLWGGEGGVKDALATDKESKKNYATTQALKAYFAERGIPFEGTEATITYDRRTNKLTVKNTSERLRKLETLIRELDIENPLVLIESKMLEIGMDDAEELGFDWLITNEVSHEKWDFSMTSPLRSTEIPNNIMINQLKVLPNFSLDGKVDLNLYLTVTAVDRTDRMETLSTPKVIATSGAEANIKMVREMYFPESWAEPDTSNVNGTSLEFQPAYPEFGEPTDVGISFTVTPTVNTNAHTISLTLQPLVTDLTGWTDYSYDVVFPDMKARVLVIMPEISSREVVTNVKVFDGQTLMIGGMMLDKHESTDDRYPVLGDIPVLGRLFSKYSSKIKRTNLIISVTTRLISKDGVPIQTNPANGLPDFRR